MFLFDNSSSTKVWGGGCQLSFSLSYYKKYVQTTSQFTQAFNHLALSAQSQITSEIFLFPSVFQP
jgi:hypothetical protein